MALRPILKNHPNNAFTETAISPSETKSTVLSSYATLNTLPFASSCHIPPLESPHVHFPPTPALSRIAMTHSSFSYDRRPIEISPNICELPERGERKLDDEDYDYFFQPHMYHSSCRSESLPSPNRSGARSASPSDRNRLSHTPIISYSTTRLYPTPSGSALSTPERPHPEPAAGVYQLPYQSDTSVPPLLVSDVSSSDTDLETCGTPTEEVGAGEVAQPGIAHTSTYFPGGLSVGPTTQIEDDRAISSSFLSGGRGAIAFAAKKIKTKVKTKDFHLSGGYPQPDTNDRPKHKHKRGTHKARPSTSFQHSLSDTSNDSNFEGCLDGF